MALGEEVAIFYSEWGDGRKIPRGGSGHLFTVDPQSLQYLQMYPDPPISAQILCLCRS